MSFKNSNSTDNLLPVSIWRKLLPEIDRNKWNYELAKYAKNVIENTENAKGTKHLRSIFNSIRKTEYGKHYINNILVKKQNRICPYCRKEIKDKFDVDHYIPLSLGGSPWSHFNLVVACPSCNRSKRDKYSKEYIRKFYELKRDVKKSNHTQNHLRRRYVGK